MANRDIRRNRKNPPLKGMKLKEKIISLKYYGIYLILQNKKGVFEIFKIDKINRINSIMISKHDSLIISPLSELINLNEKEDKEKEIDVEKEALNENEHNLVEEMIGKNTNNLDNFIFNFVYLLNDK